MQTPFNYKSLALAVTSVSLAMTANAAGLDRSGQDVTAFLQDGTYAEAVYTYIDADVAGKDIAGNATGDMAEAYDFFRYGVKADINDTFSIGVLYDEPFGAAVQYEGNNNFVSAGGDATISALTNGRVPNRTAALAASQQAQQNIAQLKSDITAAEAAGQDTTSLKTQLATATANAQSLASAIVTAATAESQKGEGTNVEIRTNNLTMLVGAKFGQNKNFQIYGGPAAQRLNGQVHLRGVAYGGMTGYDARIKQDTEMGWVAGVAYSKPEIGLKAALTYRSEIEHESSIYELVPATGVTGVRDFSVTLPESWNLDFQTGLNPTTLLTAKVRYVPWGDFEIRPPQYSDTAKASNPTLYPNGLPIVSYAKDQWMVELGLGKRLTDRLAVSGTIGWDSGAGDPATTLGPIDGYYSAGLGVKYNFTPEWSVSVGGKYYKFGDADAALPSYAVLGDAAKVGRFEDNDGYAVGVKLAYQAK